MSLIQMRSKTKAGHPYWKWLTLHFFHFELLPALNRCGGYSSCLDKKWVVENNSLDNDLDRNYLGKKFFVAQWSHSPASD